MCCASPSSPCPRVGSGPPGFLVDTEIGPARVAILDTAGELLAYAEGDGRLAAAAVCPGAKKVVELSSTATRTTSSAGITRPPWRSATWRPWPSRPSHPIDIAERNRQQLNGMGWVFDLQCHDPDARLMTYLLPNGVRDNAGNANLPGPAQSTSGGRGN